MEIEEYKFASVALLYQKYEDRAYTNKVRAVLVTVEEGDDEYDIKAKAERYCTEHFEEELEDMSVVAWSMGTMDGKIVGEYVKQEADDGGV